MCSHRHGCQRTQPLRELNLLLTSDKNISLWKHIPSSRLDPLNRLLSTAGEGRRGESPHPQEAGWSWASRGEGVGSQSTQASAARGPSTALSPAAPSLSRATSLGVYMALIDVGCFCLRVFTDRDSRM